MIPKAHAIFVLWLLYFYYYYFFFFFGCDENVQQSGHDRWMVCCCSVSERHGLRTEVYGNEGRCSRLRGSKQENSPRTERNDNHRQGRRGGNMQNNGHIYTFDIVSIRWFGWWRRKGTRYRNPFAAVDDDDYDDEAMGRDGWDGHIQVKKKDTKKRLSNPSDQCSNPKEAVTSLNVPPSLTVGRGGCFFFFSIN